RDLDRRMGLPAQLPHGFDDLRHPASVAWVVVAQPAAVGVEREPSMRGKQRAVADELTALALGAEAEVLQGKLHRDGERVVDRRVVDVGWPYPRLVERGWTRPDRAGIGQVDGAVAGVLGRLARAEHLDRGLRKAPGYIRADHDDRPAPVGDHAAVKPVQRI